MSFLEATMTLARPRFQMEIDMEASRGQVLAVIGPNGAGKSTFVQALCGLLPLDSGRVVVGDACWDDIAARVRLLPQLRSVGVMFQGLALFPKMTALDNVAFGIRSQGSHKARARQDARELLDRLGAGHLAGIRADRLSGGEGQKVALARALATSPDLLLLDEPTSKLDVTTRMEVRRTLSEVLHDFDGVAILVTHQPMEALALAEQLLVMEEGRITQEGPPTELRLRPRSAYVAGFAGTNLLEGRSRGHLVELSGGTSVTVSEAPVGDVFVAIDPNTIALHRRAPEGTPRNVWRLDVGEVDIEGERARVRLTGDVNLVAEITRAAANELRVSDKGAVWASVKATQVHVYPR